MWLILTRLVLYKLFISKAANLGLGFRSPLFPPNELMLPENLHQQNFSSVGSFAQQYYLALLFVFYDSAYSFLYLPLVYLIIFSWKIKKELLLFVQIFSLLCNTTSSSFINNFSYLFKLRDTQIIFFLYFFPLIFCFNFGKNHFTVCNALLCCLALDICMEFIFFWN